MPFLTFLLCAMLHNTVQCGLGGLFSLLFIPVLKLNRMSKNDSWFSMLSRLGLGKLLVWWVFLQSASK